MEALLEIFTQYAEEKLVMRYLRENAPKLQAAQFQVKLLSETLRATAPEAGDCLEKLKAELDNVHFCREQAFLLSGISIGLKLGRL